MDSSQAPETPILVALLDDSEVQNSHSKLRTEISELGGVMEVWNRIGENSLFEDEIKTEKLLQAHQKIEMWANSGYRTLSFLDADYPGQLRSIHEMPLLLWTQGLLQSDNRAVSVVGTRKPEPWALNYVDLLVRGLSGKGISIISGLAEGIDTRAHQAALQSGIRTVAILGNGLDTSYPKSNMQLQQEISKSGLLISQFKPNFKPTQFSFPMRNAIMSGYSSVSVIVQAGENSGTRIQGRVAVGHGRSVILSSQVARSTQWGAQLAEKPGVFVAKNVDEAIELAEFHSSRVPETLSALFSQLI